MHALTSCTGLGGRRRLLTVSIHASIVFNHEVVASSSASLRCLQKNVRCEEGKVRVESKEKVAKLRMVEAEWRRKGEREGERRPMNTLSLRSLCQHTNTSLHSVHVHRHAKTKYEEIR